MSASLELGNGNWAVKSDALLGYKTINGKYYPREFTVTRATTATRVNEAGLVELVPYNLVSWSEQFDNAGWLKGLNTITANATTAPDGTLTADKFTQTPSSEGVKYQTIYQSILVKGGINTSRFVYVKSAEMNWIYLQHYDATSNNGVYFNLNSGTIGNTIGSNISNQFITPIGDGWYKVGFTSLSTSSGISERVQVTLVNSNGGTPTYTGDGTSGVYIWGAQIVEGTSARDYLRTETRLNIPRVDYSLGGCPNILLEPQRTNLALQSSSFDSAYWGKTRADVTANTTISPSGIQDADTITANATGVGTSVAFNGGGSVSVTSGVRYTISVYAKKGNQDWLIFNINNLAYTAASRQWFNISTGVIGSTNTVGGGLSAQNPTITSVGDGWYRCSFDVLTNDTGLRGGYTLTNADASFSATLGDTVFLWGAQVEAGAYSTSFIPTTTASVTRNQDSIFKTGISSLLNPSEGTFFIEAKDITDSTSKAFQISDGTDNNNMSLQFQSNKIRFETKAGGTIYRVSDINYNLNQHNKILLTWKAGSIFGYVNGTKYILSSVSGSGNGIPTALDRINFSLWWGGQPFFGSLKQLSIWNTQLTDAQCISLTTL